MKFVKTVAKITAASLILSSVAVAKEELIAINFNNMNLEQFVKYIGKVTGKNVLINGKLLGKVNFVSTKKIKKGSIFTLANSILDSKGYTLVDHGDFLEVLKASDASGTGLEISKNISGSIMKTVLFPLRYSNASVIRAKIRPLLHRSAKVISFKSNNMLAVTAYPKTLKTIKKLIESIETDGRRGTTIVKLQNAVVKDVYPNINTMSKLLFPQTIQSEKVGVLKDDASNSIILVGKKSNVDKLLKYVQNIDIKGESIQQKMYVVPLKNSNVEDMEKILSKLVAQMNNMPISNPKKAAAAKKAKISKAMVVSDKERNALIILATPDQIKNIKEVIGRIDVAKPQVYIKAKIIEINLGKAKRIGLRYGFEGGKITTRGLFSIAGNLGAPSLLVSRNLLGFLSSTTKDKDGNTITKNPFSFGDNIKELFSVGIKVDLLRRYGAAHTLSEPSVLCSNNQDAEIYVGETRSILVSSSQGDTKDAVVRNKYSREDIGITLKVKPRLSSNSKVALKVEASIEDVVPSSGSTADRPTTIKRKVTTNAIVNNAQTVILGGLMKSSGGKSATKIPILGDIPVLGALFRSKDHTESKISVVIYLTPYIIRNSNDLTKLRKFLGELDNIEAKYSKYIHQKLASEHSKTYKYTKSNKKRIENTKHKDPLEILRTH